MGENVRCFIFSLIFTPKKIIERKIKMKKTINKTGLISVTIILTLMISLFALINLPGTSSIPWRG